MLKQCQISQAQLREDHEAILDATASLWSELRGQRLFITGGTGFFGKWLLESFCLANERFGLGAKAVVLTRHPAAFARRMPHLSEASCLDFHEGDIRTFAFPEGEFSHIIHASTTSAEATYNNESPLDKFTTIVHGAQRVYEFAARCRCRNLLLTSSGSAYGPQPPEISHMSETFNGAPLVTTPVASALGESKRASELLACMYAEQYGFEVKIARCFSFVGPYLQLDIHYAIGNFIRAALEGKTIIVNGDGTPIRSYQYTSDLMIWLWTILFTGQSQRVYNVGSMDAVSIGELARLVSSCADCGPDNVQVMGTARHGGAANSYVPDTTRAMTELGLSQRISLREAIIKTMNFYRDDYE